MADFPHNFKCCICSSDFDDTSKQPRLLKCGHSLCSECIRKQLHDSDLVTCPVDFEVTSASNEWALAKNLALMEKMKSHTVDQKDVKSPIPCETCQGEDHNAEYWCVQCEESMCALAARFHSLNKLSRLHQVVKLSELQAGAMSSPGTLSITCPIHADQYKYFDLIYKRPLCRDCFAFGHSHDCEDFSKAAKRHREHLNVILPVARQRLDEMRKERKAIDDVFESFQGRFDACMDEMKEAFDEIIQATIARKQELSKHLDEIRTSCFLYVQRRKAALSAHSDCLKIAVETSEKPHSSWDSSLIPIDLSTALTVISGTKSFFEHPLPIPHLQFDAKKALTEISKLGQISADITAMLGADSTHTTASGEGLHSSLPSIPASFVVVAKTSSGKTLTRGGAHITAVLNKSGSNNVKTKHTTVAIIDKQDGTYQGEYSLPADAHGLYELSIFLGKSHIKGSPFVVRAGFVVLSVGRRGVEYPGFRALTLNELHSKHVIETIISSYKPGFPMLAKIKPSSGLWVKEGKLSTHGRYIYNTGFVKKRMLTRKYVVGDPKEWSVGEIFR
ncbi:hypothetical protein AAMO2058_001601800 [Amorphochlora amoebiformis]